MKRNIIVISSNTQSRHTFNDVEVNTLADVKRLLDREGISYADQAFYEGVSKAEYDSDESVMPSNLPFKGKITNDLVFMLSNKSKKIVSGASLTREECYAYIKMNRLAKPIMEKYSRMYTSVSTEELNNFINHDMEREYYSRSEKPANTSGGDMNVSLIVDIIDAFKRNGYSVIRKDDEKSGVFSNDDIDEMFTGR